MAEDTSDLFTAGAIAKELQVSDGKVKKTIKELEIEPTAQKGVCNYYSTDTMIQIKTALNV